MNTPGNDNELSLAVLERALARVPGYAAWKPLDPGPGVPVDRRYAALPVLTKQNLRDHFPRGFVDSKRFCKRIHAHIHFIFGVDCRR